MGHRIDSGQLRDRRNRISISLLLILLAILVAPAALKAEPIRGAGSTFSAPIIDRWSRQYEAARADGGDFTSPDWRVDYEPVGSLAGLMRLEQQDLDFAATDAPLSQDELTKRALAQFPIVMGGIAVVVNIDNVKPHQLRLPAAVLADIYLGRITRWSDPAVRDANPGVALPDAEIAALHREDGSGSTLAFTSYLANNSADWKQKVGSDSIVVWPTGRGERGTSALVALTVATKNSISYVEYGQAVRAQLKVVSLQTVSGSFVPPDQNSFKAALGAGALDAARGFVADPASASLQDAYPMAVVTYAVVPMNRGTHRSNRVFDLFRLAYQEGASSATQLGYVPISHELAIQIEAYWGSLRGSPGN